ncbi:cyclin-dependent kinase 5, partial [Tilletia horrida]
PAAGMEVDAAETQTIYSPEPFFQNPSRFINVRFLAGGVQGAVWEAKDLLKNSKVVIKWSQCDNNGHPPNTMLREIRVLRRAFNRHIVALHAVLYDGKGIGVVLDMAQQDLKTAITLCRPATLDVRLAKFYLRQLLDGLHYLHDELKFVHLDLKPENIVLHRNHCLRIADFGLSRPIGPAGRQRTVVTMAYRPPEVFLRTPKFTAAADMFSVGVILQEMLGEVPWARFTWKPLPCFESMLDVLGCDAEELLDGSDLLPGLFDGEDGDGDGVDQLAIKGQLRFRARPRGLSSLPCSMAHAKDLIEIRDSLLVLDPIGRATARYLLKSHEGLLGDPKPVTYGHLPLVEARVRPSS